MVRQFGVIAGATAFAVGAILVKEGLVAMTMLPIASTVVMTVGAVQVMKIANGRAQLRIATGKSSAYAALRPGSEID